MVQVKLSKPLLAVAVAEGEVAEVDEAVVGAVEVAAEGTMLTMVRTLTMAAPLREEAIVHQDEEALPGDEATA